MKVLLTGALGNVGTSCLRILSEQGYQIRGFDIKSTMTEKRYEKYKNIPNFEVFWGDITNKESIKQALEEIDAIIHTAAILPPVSDKNPDLAKKVNVTGTKNLIEEAEAIGSIKNFVFSSSVSVHGIQKPDNPPVKSTDPLKPTDTYTHTKVECEQYIANCNLNWTIVRFGAVMPIETEGQEMGSLDEYSIKMLFGIPLEQKVETIHSLDAARSLVNAIGNERASKKVFLAGGGKGNQVRQRDFIFSFLKGIGVTRLPDNVFKTPQTDEDWFYTHWMDTTESQEILKFQTYSLDQYLAEQKTPWLGKRIMYKILSPFIRRTLIKKSPYKPRN